MNRPRILLCYLFALVILLGLPLPSAAQPAQTIFEFHSSFWVNLHHFLYLEAFAGQPQQGRHPATMSEEDLATRHTLTPQERATWDQAVAYYAHSMIQRDLLFDHDLIAIQVELEDKEASPDLATAQISADLKSVLLKAAPIYRAHWWPAHHRANRAWIAQLEPLVAKYGDSLKNSLAKIYETPWSTQRIRVDAVMYANWAGAYTTLYPTRVTISSRDPASQGDAALEIVFHESSHAMMDKVGSAIDQAAKAQTPPFQPGSIWHAVLFYTAGALVAQQIPGYVPYADKNGLWKRAWPDPDRALIAQDWQPHIDGKAALQPALTKLVTDLASSMRMKAHP
jgi:hypothetical protein